MRFITPTTSLAIPRPGGARRGARLLTTLVFAGCTVGPDYKPPATTAPADFGELPPATQPATQAATEPARTQPVVRWWETFNDPVLNSLVERAVESNLDLRAATARLREARALRGVVTADLYPDVDGNARYSRSRNSQNVTQNGGGVDGGGYHDLYHAGFDASWEVDVFGGVRRNIQAADADIAAAMEDRRDVLVSLLAETARDYLELRGFQRRLAIARGNLESQESSLDLTRRRRDAGVVSDLDAARAEAQVATTRSVIPGLEASARVSMHQLAVLLGREPMALVQDLGKVAPIPAAPPRVPVGLPSDLLRRRPDIRRAERRIAAASARIGVAIADLYPRFALTGSLGLESSKIKDFPNGESFFAAFGPSVSWRIFDAGRINSNIAVERTRQEQAVVAYKQAVLTALRQAEDALVNYEQERVRHQALADAVASNRRAVDLATQLYNNGRTDFLGVLDAQRGLFAAEEALVIGDLTIATHLVALYKALGGGWEIEDVPADSRPGVAEPVE